jgi:hypothetical protein
MSSSSSASVTWQVLGNTVVMGPLNTPDVESAIQEQGFLAETLLSVRPPLYFHLLTLSNLTRLISNCSCFVSIT